MSSHGSPQQRSTMSSLREIGSHLDQQSNRGQRQQEFAYELQQLPALHWSGCPNPYSSPDLCSYCHQAAQAITLPNPVAPQVEEQEQYHPSGLSQSWTHNASQRSTSSSWNGQARSRAPATELQWSEQTSTLSNGETAFTGNLGLLTSTDTTYAQALQNPTRNSTPYYVHPTAGIREQRQARLPVIRPQAAQSRPPSQAENQEFRWRPARSQRPQNRPQRRPTQRSSFGNGLARLSEENLLQARARASMASEGPSWLMQETGAGVGRLRLGIPSDEGYNSALMSQGTPSHLSTNSQRSERRKGNALRVQNETFSFVCSFADCGITFPDAAGLRRHEDRAHKAKDQRTYPCFTCIQKFHDPKDLDRHELTHLPVAERRTFACKYPSCTRVFTRKDNMNRHMRADHKVDSGIAMSRQTSYSSNNSRPY